MKTRKQLRRALPQLLTDHRRRLQRLANIRKRNKHDGRLPEVILARKRAELEEIAAAKLVELKEMAAAKLVEGKVPSTDA